jgi:hypothetical protein
MGCVLRDLSIGFSLQVPSKEELLAYGITPEFIIYIKSLNYNTFRTFEGSTSDQEGRNEEGKEASLLSPGQVQHAKLVVQTVDEINELRYVLCPRYMSDQRFWEIYFCLANKHLPNLDVEMNTNAKLESANKHSNILSTLQAPFNAIGSKIQSVTFSSIAGDRESNNNTVPEDHPLKNDERVGNKATEIGGSGSQSAAEEATTMLEKDPDLEEYLKSSAMDEIDLDLNSDGEEINLDDYLNELSEDATAEKLTDVEVEATEGYLADEEAQKESDEDVKNQDCPPDKAPSSESNADE